MEIWRSPSFVQVDHGPQRAPDQALDLLRAAAGMAGRGLAPCALDRGPGEHAVLGRDPAATLTLEPGREPILQCCSAQDVSAAELDQAGALRVHGHRPVDGDRAKLVWLAL